MPKVTGSVTLPIGYAFRPGTMPWNVVWVVSIIDCGSRSRARARSAADRGQHVPRAAAAAIRRLMRQGVRCGKVAVVCRDISKYRAAVKYEFRMADIPLYCDEPTTPEFSAS